MTDDTPPGPAWIPAFLAALRKTAAVRTAIAAAGISPSSAYFQRKTNRLFAEAWEAALAPPPAPVEPVRRGSLPTRRGGWRTCFLEALAETSSVTAAAIRANIPPHTAYRARRKEAAFATKWREALHEGYDNLEMEVLGYLRDPWAARKMDVASALRLLAAHRETVARERALREDDDEQEVLESIDRFIDEMRERRAANTAILTQAETGDDGE
jgi:hypothetical protein